MGGSLSLGVAGRVRGQVMVGGDGGAEGQRLHVSDVAAVGGRSGIRPLVGGWVPQDVFCRVGGHYYCKESMRRRRGYVSLRPPS